MAPELPTGGELLLVVALTLVPCLAVAGAGALLLRRPGRRSLRSTVLVSAVSAVATVCAGILVVSRAMFLNAHDLGLLACVLAVSATVGTGVALLLAGTLDREGRRLVGAAAAVAGEGPVWDGRLPVIAELAQVARQLQRTAGDLAQARDEAAAAERSRQELATWMSHDLRTPLAGIRAMAEALEDDMVADPVDVRRYHRQLRIDADRLSAMVDDLFELSRLESGAPATRTGETDLVALAQDVVAGCQALDAGRPLVLLGGTEPVLVQAGHQDLARALRNLVVNALRYSPAASTVQVRVRREADQAVVEVVDLCGGISAPDLPRLFDVGFRGTSARTPDASAGAGLGLAITRRLVEAHGGRVVLRPAQDGCCFALVLPALQAAPQDVPRRDVSAPTS